jgi:hypothetical protein
MWHKETLIEPQQIPDLATGWVVWPNSSVLKLPEA